MSRILVSVALLASIALVGCSTNTQNQNTAVGAVSGAAVGGVGAALLDGNPLAIGASIVGGAIVGGVIGHSMDSSDNTTTYTAIKENPTNEPTRWVNSRTGVTYTMTPTSGLFTVNGNPNCRNFHFTSQKYYKVHQYDGTACMMDDGRWHTMGTRRS